MKRNYPMIALLLIAGAAGAGSYFATVNAQQSDPPPPPPHHERGDVDGPRHDRFDHDGDRPRTRGDRDRRDGDDRGRRDNHMRRFLNLSDEQVKQVREADPKFRDDMRTIVQNLRTQRAKLAELMRSDESSDDQIMAQLDQVIEADAKLERRATEHLLKIRPHLDEDQRRRLMRLAAMRLHGGPPWRGRLDRKDDRPRHPDRRDRDHDDRRGDKDDARRAPHEGDRQSPPDDAARD